MLTLNAYSLGLTIAGLVGLSSNLPFGYLADLIGTRSMLVHVNLAQAVVTVGYLWVHSFSVFLLLASGELFLANASSALRGALIAAVAGEHRVQTRALLRAITNAAIALGAMCSGIALHYNSRAAYVVLILIDAASYLIVGIIVLGLPNQRSSANRGARGPRRHAVKLVVIRDWRYLSMTLISSVMSIHGALLQVAVPIWIVYNTSAPRWSVSLLFLLNTAACALFQVRLSKYANGIPAASRVILASGIFLLGACILIGYSAEFSTWVCLIVLACGGIMHACGEMLQQAGGWTLAFDMAPANYQGQYQGLYSMSGGIANALGPVIIIPLVTSFGATGWQLVGFIFTVTGVTLSLVGRASSRLYEANSHIAGPLSSEY